VFVLTGGKSNGCENGGGVGVGVATGAAAGVAPEIFGALAKPIPVPTRMTASKSGNRVLKAIWFVKSSP
jgi:hypothetical protein